MNRNAFALGCGYYTDSKPEEHLIVGYGVRRGSTTKVKSLHHIIGSVNTVTPSPAIAHAMWDYYQQHEKNELLIFHNHPYDPLNLLVGALVGQQPLASQPDRLFLETHAPHPQQLARRLLGQGRILFYLGQNDRVKEFNLPSVIAILDRQAARYAQF